jgi:hypothetical protein
VELRREQVNPSPRQWRWEHCDDLADGYRELGFE